MTVETPNKTLPCFSFLLTKTNAWLGFLKQNLFSLYILILIFIILWFVFSQKKYMSIRILQWILNFINPKPIFSLKSHKLAMTFVSCVIEFAVTFKGNCSSRNCTLSGFKIDIWLINWNNQSFPYAYIYTGLFISVFLNWYSVLGF